MLGESSLISLGEWPKAEKETVDVEVIELEEILKKTMEDVKHLSGLTGRKGRLCLYTVSSEEFQHFAAATEFVCRELGFNEVTVFRADDGKRYDPHNRARKARRRRPGIYLE